MLVCVIRILHLLDCYLEFVIIRLVLGYCSHGICITGVVSLETCILCECVLLELLDDYVMVMSGLLLG